jgi:hypothetical protein
MAEGRGQKAEGLNGVKIPTDRRLEFTTTLTDSKKSVRVSSGEQGTGNRKKGLGIRDQEISINSLSFAQIRFPHQINQLTNTQINLYKAFRESTATNME